MKKINIAIVGFGNIGSYFYKHLEKNKKKIISKTGVVPYVKFISARSLIKKRLVKIPKSKWTKKPLELTKRKDVDIIIELIGGADGIAKKVVFSALKNKKHVITANKALVAKHGNKLSLIAENNNVNFEYEASVAGGVPVVRSIKEGLLANQINKIYGILNGTTNFILSSMGNNKKDFLSVLDEAKKKGFAESNPISDLNGSDSAAKLRILSALAFNKKISNNKILIEGIQNINLSDVIYADKLGYKIKLLSISELNKNILFERVHPCLVPKDSYLGSIDGVLNAVVVDGLPVGKSVLQGEGAGPGPTTSAIISDLCSILRGNIKYPFGISFKSRPRVSYFNKLKYYSSSYIRIEVKDLPGVLSSITNIFAKNKISIRNLIQNPEKKNKKAVVIIVTHENLERNYKNLLQALNKNKFLIKKPTFIRIEKI
jgi:homoserine dehydrogenase